MRVATIYDIEEEGRDLPASASIQVRPSSVISGRCPVTGDSAVQ
jgi:hypothetical protein